MTIQLVTTNPIYVQTNCGGQTVGPPPSPIISDAIIKIRPVFSNGFETVGQLLRGGQADLALVDTGTDDSGQFKYAKHHATGGRDGGGWLETVSQTGRKENLFVYHLAQHYGESAQLQYSAFCAFNLQGLSIPTNLVDARGPSYSHGLHILGFGSSAGGANQGADIGNTQGDFSFSAASMLTLSPNGTLFVQTAVAQYNELFQVPADDWWGVEFQCGHQYLNNTRSGFALVKVYLENGPVEGVPAITQIGVHMPNTNISAIAIGSAVDINGAISGDANNIGMSGLGIDDFVAAGPYGTEKRFFGSIYVAQTVPVANGDQVNSTVQFDSTHVSPGTGSTLGQLVVHGDSNRYKNIDGRSNIRPFNDVMDLIPRSPGQGHNDSIADDVSYGYFSQFSHSWIDFSGTDGPPVGVGPLIPPYSANADYVHQFDPSREPIRNTLHDESIDLYQYSVLRSGVEIEGIMPFYRGGAREITGKTFFVGVFGGYGDFFSFAELHAPVIPDDGFDNCRRIMKFILKDVNGSFEIGNYTCNVGYRYSSVANPTDHSPNGLWISLPGWFYNPFSFLTEHPITSVTLRGKPLSVVQAFQLGLRGSFENFDAIPVTSSRWLQIDVLELGLDYVFRKEIPNLVEHPLFPPRAFLTTSIGASPFHILTATDYSTDWDGTVVSRVIDWGDGSNASVAVNTPTTHTYTPGIYTVSVTATDNDGLVDVYSVANLHMYNPAVAAFTLSSTGGNEIDCTDASIANDEVISGRHYDFGDGNTSTATNPSHTYAAPGSYTVTLVLTTNISAVGSITVSNIATVPFVGAVPGVVAGCSLPAIVLANTVNIQGDDFAGGNPPLPAYTNTANFADYYFTGVHHRHAYDFEDADFNDGINFIIDNVNTFHGHNTLKMAWGKPAGSEYDGAGWSALPSNDADPVETLISSNKHWLRIRFFGQPGIMSDPFESGSPLLPGECFFGQGILGVNNDGGGQFMLVTRNNALYLDYFGNGTGGTCVIDPSLADTLILGAGYVDVVMLYDGSVANQIRTAFWIESACNLAGKNPKIDHTFTTTATVAQQTMNLGLSSFSSSTCDFFISEMNAQGPLKYVWVADWDDMPFSASGNPYGVSGI